MLQVTRDAGDDFLTVVATGKIHRAEFVELEESLRRAATAETPLKVLFRMHDFHGFDLGARLEDVKFDLTHFMDIHRLAIVGESGWQRFIGRAAQPFTAEQSRYFEANDLAAAKDWLRQPD